MDLEIYKKFIAVVESGSLTEAAHRLHLAQPALSIQIKNLQEKYNAQLIKTKPGIRHLEITEAGRIFYEKAKYICSLEENLSREMLSLNNGRCGILRISASPSLCVGIMQKYLLPFIAEHPNTNFELQEVSSHAQAEHLLHGISEIAVSNAPVSPMQSFTILNLSRNFLGAVYSKSDRRIRFTQDEVQLEQLQKIPICIMRDCLDDFLKACQQMLVIPRITGICTSRLSCLCWARAQKGIGILPMNAYDDFGDDIKYVKISGEQFLMEKIWFIMKNQKLSKIAESFIKFCRKSN